MGDQDASIEVRTKSYSALAAAGRESDAAFQAGMLGIEHFQRGEPALGMGWLQRAHRHLDDRPEEPAHGFLAGVEATVARFGGDLDGAMALASTAAEIGRRTHDPDVWALGLHSIGLVHIAAGRIDEGVPLLDEAMTSVLAGELSSYFTGVVYCNVIEACLQIADVSRAGQWSEAADRWCASIPAESPFPGLCRVNRAHVAELRGAWSEAVAEAERASHELLRFDPGAAGAAAYGSGEIHRRTGNLAEAERWFARARELGFDPEPGAALLHARRGGATTALTSLALVARQDDHPPLRRARLLAALVEVAIEAGDPEAAANASADLDHLAERHPAAALRARALSAAGQVGLAAPPPSGRSCDCRTRPRALACSSGRRCERSGTKRAPTSSSGPRSPSSIGSVPGRTRSACSRSSSPPRCRAVSRCARQRCSGSSLPACRTVTSRGRW